MKKYELIPTDGRKSFYGKAIVELNEKNGSKTLYSYGTKICSMSKDGGIKRHWGGWSATTGRHIKAFCGFNKSEFMALPYKTTLSEKAAAYNSTLYRKL